MALAWEQLQKLNPNIPRPQGQQGPAPAPARQAPSPAEVAQTAANERPQPQQQSGGYGTTQAEQVAAANKRTAEQAALPPQQQTGWQYDTGEPIWRESLGIKWDERVGMTRQQIAQYEELKKKATEEQQQKQRDEREAAKQALLAQSPAAQAQAAAEERAAKLGDLQKQQLALLPEWMKQTNSGQAAAEREAKLAAERKQQGLERPPGPEAITNAPQPAPAAAAPAPAAAAPPPPPPPPPPAPTIGLASPAAKPAETAASSPVQIMQQAAQARPATGWADMNAPGSLARNLGSRNPPPSFSALMQAMQQRGRAY